MRAGSQSRQVSIETPVVDQDPNNGSVVTTWNTFLSRIWVEWEYMLPTRSEIVTGQAKMNTTAARMRMRWRDDVNAKMRVTLHGETDRLFQIVGGPAEIPGEGRKSRIELYMEQYTIAGDAP